MPDRIDVIVPAHRAHETLERTLESLAVQSIADDLDVTVIDDECPEGDYRDVVKPFESRLNIRLIRLPHNLGPGGARQAGIDATYDPYFTCIDADDAYTGASSLELLRNIMDKDDSVQCCGGGLVYLDFSGEKIRQNRGGVSMNGKLFRRSFTELYDLRFNGTRANEDYGYNLAVDLLCDNENEKACRIPDVVVDVHLNPDSITGAADSNFAWDQALCGLIDNSIWAIDLAKRYRPESDAVNRNILRGLLIAYTYLCVIAANAPWYADQALEYAKKYYHQCYRRWYIPAFASMEKKLKPETTKMIFEIFVKRGFFSLPEDFEPALSFDEFMEIMRTEEYDPDHIYDVWAKMSEQPELKSLMDMNEETGVCPRGYRERNGNGNS